MKIKFILAASALAWCASLEAATLSVSTAVQSQPDPSSPVIAILRAGSVQPLPTDKVAVPPSGWTAVEVQGPFEGYVKNKDLTKQLDVHPGSKVYLGPKESAGILTVFAVGDKAEITGLRGGWTQVRLDKTLVGYIQTSPAAPTA
ncbi:MAG TPA: SH3 domain-containing protein, partial [Opitutaceae bacterium]